MTQGIQEWLDNKQRSTCQALMRVDDDGELVRKAGRRKFYKGKRPIYWAKKYGVRIEMIYRHLKQYGNLKIIRDPKHRKGPGSKALRTYRGKIYSEWAQHFGVTWVTIDKHIRWYGHLRFVNKPNGFFRKREFHSPKGVFTTLRAMAKANKVSYDVCWARVRHLVKWQDWYEGKPLPIGEENH